MGCRRRGEAEGQAAAVGTWIPAREATDLHRGTCRSERRSMVSCRSEESGCFSSERSGEAVARSWLSWPEVGKRGRKRLTLGRQWQAVVGKLPGGPCAALGGCAKAEASCSAGDVACQSESLG